MKIRTLVVISVLLLSLSLAACTRQASTAVVPTQPPAPPTANAAEDPTMAAVKLTVAVRATESAKQTQEAGAKGVPGADATPTTEAATPSANELPTATPVVAPVTTATPVPVATPVPAAVACPNPYIVKQGDWIYKIARDCRLDPAAIIAVNPGISPNFIIPGQKLNLPSGSAAAQPFVACTGTYTVVKGDTLYNIAYRCGLTSEQLASANAIRSPFRIYPGDVLKFP